MPAATDVANGLMSIVGTAAYDAKPNSSASSASQTGPPLPLVCQEGRRTGPGPNVAGPSPSQASAFNAVCFVGKIDGHYVTYWQ
jgi:hypothetical protein